MKTTFYDLLQVSSKADAEVIHAAYVRLVQILEARADAGAATELKAARLRIAYETLGDPVKRARYDHELRATPPAPAVNNTFLEWWGSPKMTALATAAVALIGYGLYLNYAKVDRKASAPDQKAANEKLRIEKVEAGRVENERMLVDRVTTSIDKDIDNSKDLANRAMDMRQQQLDVARRQAEQRMEQQRRTFERQEQSQAQNQRRAEEARQRAEEQQAAALVQARLERDRRDLCRIEQERYGRAVSCQ